MSRASHDFTAPDITPNMVAIMASYSIGDDPKRIRATLARIEANRQRWRYRLFAGRWRREADRLLIGRLREKLEDCQRCN